MSGCLLGVPGPPIPEGIAAASDLAQIAFLNLELERGMLLNGAKLNDGARCAPVATSSARRHSLQYIWARPRLIQFESSAHSYAASL
jgi:hypothetical protein